MMEDAVALCAVRRTRSAHGTLFKFFIGAATQYQEKTKTNKEGGKCRDVVISRWYARCAVEVWDASGMRVISGTLTCSRVYTTSSCPPMS